MKKFKIIVVILICCGSCTTTTFAETQTNNEPNEPAYLKLIPPDKLKEDLDFLFKTIEEVHPDMYAYTSKEEFEPMRDELYRQIKHPMTRLEFYKFTAPIVASLKNAHTFLAPFFREYKKYLESGGKVFPLELRLDDLKVVLAKNYSPTSLPLGGEIITINERAASEIFKSFSHWFAAESKNTNPQLIANATVLRALLLLEFGSVESWHLKIKANNTEVSSYTVKSVSAAEFKGQGGTTAFELKNSYQYFHEYNAVLLRINSFGGDVGKLKKFLNESFQKIHKEKVSNIIIDVRENTGGSDTHVHPLVEYLTGKPYRLYEKTEIKISPQSRERIEHIRRQLPDKFTNKKDGDIVTLELPFRALSAKPFRFTGQIFVLSGPRSFSASTIFASTIKCSGIGTLVGVETPDPTTLYADIVYSELPNSELRIAVASKCMIAACGKPDGRGVIPDYEVKQKLEDTAKGIDTVLQFTLDLIKQGSKSKISTKLKGSEK
ncbi:S41 family peptidase [Planctomycetota bacterium]